EEDGYAPRFVGAGIDDGYILEVDPSSGTTLAFALIVSGLGFSEGGHLVAFRSTDGGMTWSVPQRVGTEIGTNPVAVDSRSGSMLGGKALSLIYSTNVDPPFDRVMSTTVPLPLVDTPDRYDYSYTNPNGTPGYVRAYHEPGTDRGYYYFYDYASDGSFTVTYC